VLEAAFVVLEFRSPSRRILSAPIHSPPSLVRRIGPSALSESDGKSWFKEASNEIELAISSFARNFNKRLDPMSLDRFIYLPLSLATSGL
jgi:hypothetical protein